MKYCFVKYNAISTLLAKLTEPVPDFGGSKGTGLLDYIRLPP
jgi:hypothetical protein